MSVRSSPIDVRHEGVATTDDSRDQRARKLAIWLAGWAFVYGCYRAYYAFGGTFGMIGVPVSKPVFQAINGAGAAIIMAAAVLPLILARPALRRTLPFFGWAGAVGCCMHAVVNWTLRVLSVTGVHPTELPGSVWVSYDRNVADLQDLFLNEPWFFVEGLLWGALALVFVRASRRRLWLTTAVAAMVLTSALGILTGVGLLDSFIVL